MYEMEIQQVISQLHHKVSTIFTAFVSNAVPF